jgi:hypothetical protein
VPALVTPEQWDAVRAQAAANKQNARRNAKHHYKLRGLLDCGVCQTPQHTCTMVGTKLGQLYQCSAHWRAGDRAADGPVCRHKVPCAVLEAAVWARTMEFMLHPETLECAPRPEEVPDAASAERAARARLATLSRQAQMLSDNLALATTPAQIAAMLEQIERVDAQKRAAAQELDDIATAAERARAQQVALAQAQQTCRRIAEGLESATPAQQEALLHLVVDRVTVYRDHARIRFALPTDEKAAVIALSSTLSISRREGERVREAIEECPWNCDHLGVRR